MAEYAPLGHEKYHKSPLLVRARKNWLPIASGLWLLLSIYPVITFLFGSSAATPAYTTNKPSSTITKTIVLPSFSATPLPGAPDPEGSFRLPDGIDGFQDFKQSNSCHVNSLDLHGPFEPLCEDKESLMRAMSWGGRIGVDAPYSPRDCDMRWFSPQEICAIMKKFSRINIMGDSMMRNLAVAMSMYLRADLENGGRATWAADPEGHDCRCEASFEDKACTFHAVVSTQLVVDNDPESLVCGTDITPMEYFHVLEHPIKQEDIDTYLMFQPKIRPKKPIAYIMGHGLWNDLDKDKTFAWYDQLLDATTAHGSYLLEPGAIFPRLAITPNAAGDKKPDIFIARQGNIALTRFEKAVGEWARAKGMDHLGTWNMSIQAFNPDGTHGGMRVNLIKAQMVFNWLNAVDTGAK